MINYLYDDNHVRYELIAGKQGGSYNWLFLPGGPGADSSYFRTLVDILDLPGNIWLVDLPGNGDNIEGAPFDDHFDRWIEIFPSTVKRFKNPVLVGHSFGGMLPLLFPEMEALLKGFVILNSAPSLWLAEAVSYAKQFELPDLSGEMDEFTKNPSQMTFETALNACMPYYFPKKTLDKGRELVKSISFRYQPAVWWQKKVVESNYSAKWVPEVPTLVVGGTHDCICPFTLFQKDERFHRPNIDLLIVEDAGHFGWIDKPEAIKEAFATFLTRLAN